MGLALAWNDAAPDALPIVLTNRGLVFARSDASGLRFGLRCNESYLVTTTALPSLLTTPSGDVVLQTTLSVSQTSDHGCSFRTGQGLPKAIPLGGFTQNPRAKAQLLVTTQSYEADSQILASDDFGRTWTARSVNAALSIYERLLFAANGRRVYASGKRFDTEKRELVPLWAVSDDGGTTFADRDQPSAREPIGAHPSHSDVVWVRETTSTGLSNPHDRVLKSRDGGATLTEVLALESQVTAFTIAPDARRVWLGTDTRGLWASSDGGDSFARVDAERILSVRCLQHRQGRLWMCATIAPDTHGVYVSDDGASFTAKLTFDQVREPVTCDAAENVCEAPWRDWERELLSVPTPVSSGSSSGPEIVTGLGGPKRSVEMPANTAPSDHGRAPSEFTDGCALQRSGDASLLLYLALAAFIARRRRRHRRRTG